jgi:hypothetical protein
VADGGAKANGYTAILFLFALSPIEKSFRGKKKLPRLAIFRVCAGDGGIVMLLQMAAKSDESSD